MMLIGSLVPRLFSRVAGEKLGNGAHWLKYSVH